MLGEELEDEVKLFIKSRCGILRSVWAQLGETNILASFGESLQVRTYCCGFVRQQQNMFAFLDSKQELEQLTIDEATSSDKESTSDEACTSNRAPTSNGASTNNEVNNGNARKEKK